MTARLTLGLLLLILALLQYRLWISPEGAREVWRLEGAIAEQRAENDALRTRNDLLEAEVHDLRDGLEAVEERARNELGMIRENESFFQVVESAPPAERSPQQ